MKSMMTALVCGTLISVVAMTGCEKKAVAKPVMSMPVPTVTVGAVDSTLLGAPFRFMGYVEAINRVNIQPRVSGYLEKILFQDGAFVHKDSPLVEIERTTYEAKVAVAEATLLQTQADLVYAERTYQRLEALIKKDAISQTSFDDAKRSVDLCLAKVKEAEARLKDAKNDLSYTTIYAPLSGHIGPCLNYVGNYVTEQSAPLAEIVQLNPIYVRFAISEAAYQTFVEKAQAIDRGVETLLDAEVTLANGEVYHAKWHVAFTDNKICTATGTIMIWLEFDNPQYILTHGGYVTITLKERFLTPHPEVPLQAVLRDKSDAYVYVVENGVAKRRKIECEATTRNTQIIKSGIAIGEEIVVDGIHKVIEGAPIRAIKN